MRPIGEQKDVTPLCSKSRVDYIWIVCTIKTKGNRPKGCRLQYQHGRGFENECDSRFRLVKENRVVFLQMINLTAEDSGKSTCECSRSDGTDIIHLLISAEGACLLCSFSHTCFCLPPVLLFELCADCCWINRTCITDSFFWIMTKMKTNWGTLALVLILTLKLEVMSKVWFCSVFLRFLTFSFVIFF